ncbi:MAG: hypothetical protein RLZZ58_879 [Pseudomonadota bacterium]|jgi:hypothetical protein
MRKRKLHPRTATPAEFLRLFLFDAFRMSYRDGRTFANPLSTVNAAAVTVRYPRHDSGAADGKSNGAAATDRMNT